MQIRKSHFDVVVLISANAEWKEVSASYSDKPTETSPYGQWFGHEIDQKKICFMQSGWGKIAASGSAQFAIDRWQPSLIINLGTCGGFEGEVKKGDILLVDETCVYDIYEQMGDSQAAIDVYTTKIDLSWLKQPYPQAVIQSSLLSADRDIFPAEIPMLKSEYHGIAADWESGAIAWVAQKNKVKCLILRGVTDLVDENCGEAYGKISVFHSGTERVMSILLDHLSGWLQCSFEN